MSRLMLRRSSAGWFLGWLAALGVALALTGCGGQGGDKEASSASGSSAAAGTAPASDLHFPQARALAAYLRRNWRGGCTRFAYLVEPGKAVHPSSQGETPQSTGLGRDSFEMNNRLIEDAGCQMKGTSSTLGMERFDGSGLLLAKYRHWLESSILPEACQLADPGDTIVEAIWRDHGSLWSLEPSSVNFEDIIPLTVSRRKALLAEITDRVSGDVVAVPC
jgi:hypothetical protein